MMKTKDLIKIDDFTKIFTELSRNTELWKVFEDFLEITSLTYANFCELDKAKYKEREDRYQEIIKKYKKDELDKFSELIATLIQLMDREIDDYLGRAFMELELGNKWRGQFFTPMSTAKLMARTNLRKDIVEESIKERGFIAGGDMAVGGGVTMLALADTLKSLGYNYQRQFVVIASDLDEKACQMTFIQLSILGIPAVIRQMDALTLVEEDRWTTWAYRLGFWEQKLEREKRRNGNEI